MEVSFEEDKIVKCAIHNTFFPFSRVDEVVVN